MPTPDSDDLIALIGDVHAEDSLLHAALADAKGRGISLVLCVGDIVDGQGDVDRCCELLREHQVVTVRGNHERWLLNESMRDLPHATTRADVSAETLAYIEALPTVYPFSTRAGRALLCHGLGSNDMASVMPDDFGYSLEVNSDLHTLIADPEVDLVLNGHTHRRMVRHFTGVTIVNAGTLRREHHPGYVTIDFTSGAVSWVDLANSYATTTTALGQLLALK